MAAQQVLFAETIIGMKKAISRGEDASESDDSIGKTTNRGNKLKRKAKFVQEGYLHLADGPKTYRRKINYNGYERSIISRNPPRVDPDGDVIEDDDAESYLNLTDAEDDPYSEVRIENILRPLTSAADLDKHPALSLPYKQKNLDEMVHNAQEMLHRERHALWRLKRLQTQFQGDPTWIPCGAFDSDGDIFNFLQPQQPLSGPPSTVTQDFEAIHRQISNSDKSIGGLGNTEPVEQKSNGLIEDNAKELEMRDAYESGLSGSNEHGESLKHNGIEDQQTTQEGLPSDVVTESKAEVINTEERNGTTNHSADEQVKEESNILINGDKAEEKEGSITNTTEGDTTMLNEALVDTESVKQSTANSSETLDSVTQETLATAEENQQTIEQKAQTNDQEQNPDDDAQAEEEDANPPHRMTTRARAQAEDPELENSTHRSSPSPSLTAPTNSSYPATHPFYIAPLHGFHDRDFGLPSELADDIRGMLNLYIQKQEEVVRQTEQLHNGLQKAMRLRGDVWEWCRAEGHVGEISDGEDWIDNERWGFEEGERLKKGEEVDDEEVIATGKKTRRRAAADR